MEEFKTFADVEAWLATVPNQVTGQPMFICETGEPYMTVSTIIPVRRADFSVGLEAMCRSFQKQLAAYLNSREGTVYWRIKPEWNVVQWQVFMSYWPDGPDYDLVTDRKGIADKDWLLVKAYCRLCKSDKPAIKNEIAA